jgi:3-oxoadipate enol-lactonase
MPKTRINSIEMYYELHGPEDAPLVVLNNGIIMNAATSWAFQTRTLSRRWRLLQYDCRGQGQSDHPASHYSMELHADDLANLLEYLGYEQAHLLGISYGGEVAQAFALCYPERVQSLILADTVSEVGPELKIIIGSWIEAARRKDPQAFFDATVPWNFSPSFISANPHLLADARKRYEALDFPAIIRLCESFLKVNFTARLQEITAPTCIIVGGLDLLKGLAYAQILQAGISHAELHILKDAGHASCWERPEEFNSIVLGFLSKQL